MNTRQRLLPWIAAAIVVTAAGAQAMCVGHRDAPRPHYEPSRRPVPTASASPSYAEPKVQALETETRSSRRSWCEPVDLQLCAELGSACSPMPDGTRRQCRRRRLRRNVDELVCVPSMPSPSTRAWRRARLRTIVDAVCKRRDGCEPAQLDDYLAVLAMRETTLRPWKLHRLGEDADAAKSAWARRSEVFRESPAFGEPWRWLAGVGYYGQNPALWLDLWDASAEPETLCGEVESTLVHLRAARHRYAVLAGGVVCSGELFHGTSEDGGPSWYDISLVNSGSGACPASNGSALSKRESFERRAARVGLDPYGRVRRSMLGAPIDASTQDQFAEELHERLDVEHPHG